MRLAWTCAMAPALALAIVGCAAGQSYDRAATGSTTGSQAESASLDGVPGRSGAGEEALKGARGGNAQLASMPLQRRSVVRRATLQLRVDSVEQAEKRVNQTVESLGGYVENVTSSDLSSDRPVLTVSTRIPVDSFGKAMESFESLGVRLSKSVSAEDVTERIVDMDARLKTMLAQEETYRGMLRSQRNLRDSIELQQQLMGLRQEIESMAAQRKSLGGLASLSTIEIKLQQRSDAAAAAKRDDGTLAESWAQAWTSATSFFRSMVVAVFWIIAFSPAWLLMIGLGVFLRRSATRARANG